MLIQFETVRSLTELKREQNITRLALKFTCEVGTNHIYIYFFLFDIIYMTGIR